MFSWHNIPFARLLFPFAAGILVHEYLYAYVLPVSALVLVLIIALLFFKNRSGSSLYNSSMRSGYVIILSAFVAAMSISELNKAGRQPYHYSSYKSITGLKIRICNAVTEKKTEYKAYAEAEAVTDSTGKINPCTGKLLVRLKKDLNTGRLRTGDCLMLTGILTTPDEANNPGDFDYKRYLKHKGVVHILDARSGSVTILSDMKWSVFRFAEELRDACISILKSCIKDKKAAAISEALLLGYKDDLEFEQTEIFMKTGTLHVLAVSGMHAGLIFMILNFITAPLKRRKSGMFFQCAIILSALWIYICMTGLSGSVIRAGVMCTLISVAGLFKRKQNIFNTIYASAFLMLAFCPAYLFDAGFQLSYAAVAGIVFLYPPIRKYYLNSRLPLRYILDLCTVTVCAQVFTLPLSLYYFNQFPVYFLFSNLLIIPVFTLLLFLLILLLPLSLFPAAALPLGKLIGVLVQLSGEAMYRIDALPTALIENIQFHLTDAILMMAAIICTSLLVIYKRSGLFIPLISLILIYSVNTTVRDMTQDRQKFMAFHKIYGHDVFTCINGKQAIVFADQSFFSEKGYERSLKKYLCLNGVKKIKLVNDSEFFVSTNFHSIPGTGFQFFDRIMTMKNTVHLSIHPGVILLLKGYEDNVMEILSKHYNNLIFSNKISNKRRNQLSGEYFKSHGKSVKLSSSYQRISVGQKLHDLGPGYFFKFVW